jgi:hypothetical protein
VYFTRGDRFSLPKHWIRKSLEAFPFIRAIFCCASEQAVCERLKLKLYGTGLHQRDHHSEENVFTACIRRGLLKPPPLQPPVGFTAANEFDNTAHSP